MVKSRSAQKKAFASHHAMPTRNLNSLLSNYASEANQVSRDIKSPSQLLISEAKRLQNAEELEYPDNLRNQNTSSVWRLSTRAYQDEFK